MVNNKRISTLNHIKVSGAERNDEVLILRTTLSLKEKLATVDNQSEFIRIAIAEKFERDESETPEQVKDDIDFLNIQLNKRVRDLAVAQREMWENGTKQKIEGLIRQLNKSNGYHPCQWNTGLKLFFNDQGLIEKFCMIMAEPEELLYQRMEQEFKDKPMDDITINSDSDYEIVRNDLKALSENRKKMGVKKDE